MKILLTILGSIGFAITLEAPFTKLLWCAGGITISAVIYETQYERLGTFTAVMLASLLICLYSEITARIIKTPATVIILPSTIPLLPGSSLFYAINFLLSSNTELFKYHISEAAETGLGIAVGAVISTIFIITIKELKVKR